VANESPVYLCILTNLTQACDQVLKSVETYLTGFQADLGAVSVEIETLQSRSTALNTKLENRRVVEKLLGPAVEDLSLSPEIVRKIADGPIDEAWIRALGELEKRSKAVDARTREQKKMQALEDLVPLLENLTNKVSRPVCIEARLNYFTRPSSGYEITS
jgi:vacuolar protein sorting-associated protein 52